MRGMSMVLCPLQYLCIGIRAYKLGWFVFNDPSPRCGICIEAEAYLCPFLMDILPAALYFVKNWIQPWRGYNNTSTFEFHSKYYKGCKGRWLSPSWKCSALFSILVPISLAVPFSYWEKKCIPFNKSHFEITFQLLKFYIL